MPDFGRSRLVEDLLGPRGICRWGWVGVSLQNPELIIPYEVGKEASGLAIDQTVGFLVDFDPCVEQEVAADEVGMETGAIGNMFEPEASCFVAVLDREFDLSVSVNGR
jgi:hypothetical protein